MYVKTDEHLTACLECLNDLKQRTQLIYLASELAEGMECGRAIQIHLLLDGALAWLESGIDDMEYRLREIGRSQVHRERQEKSKERLGDNPPLA